LTWNGQEMLPPEDGPGGGRPDDQAAAAGPDQITADLLTEHASAGWQLGWDYVRQADVADVADAADAADVADVADAADSGPLGAAIGHLEAAVLDGINGFTVTDPELFFLLGHLLIVSSRAEQDVQAVDRANMAFVEGLDCPGLEEELRLGLLDGAALACLNRVAYLEPGADLYRPTPELAEGRDALVAATETLWLAVPPGHKAADGATAAYIRALACRLIGRTGPGRDSSELLRLARMRPDLRETEGVAGAAILVLRASQALMVAFEHNGQEELLLAAADLVTEAQSWPDLAPDFAPLLTLTLASAIANAPDEGVLAPRLDEARAMLDQAVGQLSPDSPERAQAAIQRAMLLHRLAVRGVDAAAIEEAAREIGCAILRLPDQQITPEGAVLASLLGGVLDTRFRRRQDLRDVRAGLQLTERAMTGLSSSSMQRAVLLANRGVQLLRMAWIAGDADAAGDALEALRNAQAIMPAGSPLTYQLYATLAAALMTRSQAESGAQQRATLWEAWATVSKAAEEQPPTVQTLVTQAALAAALGHLDPQVQSVGERAVETLQESRSRLAGQGLPTDLIDLASSMLHGFQAIRLGDDLAALDAALARLDEQYRAATYPAMISQLLGMQQARLLRHRDNLRWQRSLQAARDQPASQDVPTQKLMRWLQQGGSDLSAIRDFMAHNLTERARDSPDRRQSREIGLEVLHGHALRVLLQTGTHDAISIARVASGDSHEVVAWCLADGADDEAILSLETGRGLTVLAAGATGSVIDRLEAIGEPGLAQDWRQSHETAVRPEPPGRLGIPGDTRHRALDRLAASGDLAGLLQPPDREGLAATLRHLGYDAMVYLIPEGRSHADLGASRPLRGGGNFGRPGGALMVTAGGQLRWKDLPALTVGSDSMISNYLRVHRALLTAGGSSDDRDEWRQALERVSQWAWTAAMGPLQPMIAHIHTARRARVVFVPVDALSVVPWHAAYPADDHQLPFDERRYALDSVTFSYAASGTLLSRIARRSPPAVGSSVLLVGDPGGDLPYAQMETQALRDAFYPEATIWGEPPEMTDGAATPARVRTALTEHEHSLFHYAGHAAVDAMHPGSSALVMGEQRLKADRISRLAPEQSYCVCLAACTTHVTAEAFDEAFTLSTAFLLGGASSVLGSLWRIKDAGTAVLTFMVHHYLSQGSRPADALHRAQMWMLNRSRRVPESMPDRMRNALPGLELTDPVVWAALTHQGY